ncbi:MAG: DUF6494 family protein [Gemmatimonadales bacterium]
MNDDAFNLSIRKFLKQFGVTSQRQIERAVAEAMEAGTLRGNETLTAKATLTVGRLGLEETVEAELTLG